MKRLRLKSDAVKTAVVSAAVMLAITLFSAAAFAVPTQEQVDNMSNLQKMQAASKVAGNYEDTMATISGIGVLFGVIIFSFIFFRRWRIPRMGYFLVTLVILFSRFRVPTNMFWKTGAVTAGLFSLMMFFVTQKKRDFDSRKEPLYFVFNAFTVLIIAFSTEPFTMSLAGISLIASLFFIVTLKPVPHGKFTQHDADAKIMETLEKKARRRI
jgi:hypothetical protein